MFADRKAPPQKPIIVAAPAAESGRPQSITLLTIVGEHARMEGKLDITDSIQIECEVGGEVNCGGRLVIGQKGVVNANVQTVDAIIMGHYEGNMVATGNVEIAETGRRLGLREGHPGQQASGVLAAWRATGHDSTRRRWPTPLQVHRHHRREGS